MSKLPCQETRIKQPTKGASQTVQILTDARNNVREHTKTRKEFAVFPSIDGKHQNQCELTRNGFWQTPHSIVSEPELGT